MEYNITGLENLEIHPLDNSQVAFEPIAQQQPIKNDLFLDDASYIRDVETSLKKKKGRKSRKGPKKYKFKVPEGPSKSSPPGPAYSPQSLTWTRYVQYFANLTHINNDFLETQPDQVDPSAATTTTDTLSNNDLTPHTIFGLKVSPEGGIESSKWKEGKHGKHQGKRPKPEPHPHEFVFEVEYDTRKDRGFKDLTVRRWVEYARRIGQSVDKKASAMDEVEEQSEDEVEQEMEEETDFDMETAGGKNKGKKHKKKKGKHHKASKEWFAFVKRAFVGTMDPHEIKELFGASPPLEAEEVLEENMEL